MSEVSTTTSPYATAYVLVQGPDGRISFTHGGSFRSFDAAALDAQVSNDLIGHLGFKYFAVTAEGANALDASGVFIHVP